MMRRSNGFTIVEILIVIVVIAILAAIIVVAYNGMQTRAGNSKTVMAVQAYAKAMALYKIDNGTHPQARSCLGIGYSGGTCRSDGGWIENGDNLNTVLLAPYLKGTPPTPNLKSSDYNGTLIITGAFYDYNNASYNSNGGGIGVIFHNVSDCPVITGTNFVSSTASNDSGRLCRYAVSS